MPTHPSAAGRTASPAPPESPPPPCFADPPAHPPPATGPGRGPGRTDSPAAPGAPDDPHTSGASDTPYATGVPGSAEAADDVVRWAAFSCLLVPVVLVGYGASVGGAAAAALGLAAVTAACRVLLRRSERNASRPRPGAAGEHRAHPAHEVGTGARRETGGAFGRPSGE
ncbi:hypothetical protein ABZ714_07220 [Streptomyces sp. NPDC006798]|uniref:hypothetical protein n=1 Tax=Streptomyces sp. NPDC006798 TaxID=3155462 RepID=UPI0033CC7136